VTVLMPAYNVAGIVPRAIRSALSQTYEMLEVVIVDGASDDATCAVVEDIAAQDPRVRLLRCDRNGGPGVARSVGLGAAHGDWIAVLDADDTMEPDRLATLVEYAARRHLDGVADNLVLVDPELDAAIGVAFPLGADSTFSLNPERLVANSIPGGRVNLGWMKPIVRRRFLDDHAVDWRPLRHAEDFLFTMELLFAGARFDLLGRPGYRYTLRRGGKSGRKSPHTRAQRSVSDQIRTIDIILTGHRRALTPALKRALVARKPQIEVTTAVLEAMEAWRDRRWLDAVRGAAAAATRPKSLAYCMNARFGRHARRLFGQ